MRPMTFRRLSLCLLVTPCCFAAWPMSVTAQTPTPTLIVPTSTPTCPPCGCAMGYLHVSGPVVEPSKPAVGDLVTFTFPFDHWGAGDFECKYIGICEFQQDDSLLDGNEPPARQGGTVVVRRRVAGAGVTTVQLQARVLNEYVCYVPSSFAPNGCQETYSWSCWLEGSSPPFRLELAEAPSPTPTPTLAATPTLSATPALCVGDCHNDRSVTVDELLTMVDIALGTAEASACLPGDANTDGKITIDEILAAVNNALNGCPG